LAARGENEEARTWLERSLASHRATGDDLHIGVGLNLLTLAEISRSEGKIAQAHEGYRKALAELKLIDPPAPHFVAAAQVAFGASLSQAGEWEEARPLLASALETSRQINGETSPNLCHYLSACAENWMRLGDLERAEPLILESIEITRAGLPPDGISSAKNFEVYARLLLRQGRPAEALPILETSLAVYEAQFSPSHPSVRALREQVEKLRQ
ncbi:MAG: tetratricopeptide repeat protein, partial [Planctomycetota bacterium]